MIHQHKCCGFSGLTFALWSEVQVAGIVLILNLGSVKCFYKLGLSFLKDPNAIFNINIEKLVIQ